MEARISASVVLTIESDDPRACRRGKSSRLLSLAEQERADGDGGQLLLVLSEQLLGLGSDTRVSREALRADRPPRRPYERRPDEAPKELHNDACEPGEKVQTACSY
jgi:hypothetical protein